MSAASDRPTPPTTLQPGTVKLRLNSGKVEVPAMIHPCGLAVHRPFPPDGTKRPHRWIVSSVRHGYRLGTTPTLRGARRVMDALADIPWNRPLVELMCGEGAQGRGTVVRNAFEDAGGSHP